MTSRLKSAAAVAFIALWFFGHTWRGLFVGFQDDDMMNLYHAWVLPWYQLLAANLVPFTPIYRPLGSALYRILYVTAGLHPLPFRICAYALMTLNLWLIFRLAKLLTESTEIAVLAALIGSYHNRLMDIYLNNGTIYDVLCFTFYYLSLCFYISARRNGDLTWRQLARFCVLYTFALNSKEMAVTLPAVLLAYEWIWHRRANIPAVWISGIITALAILAKTSSTSPFTGNTEYSLQFSLHQFLSNFRPNTGELFFAPPGQINTAEVISIFAVIWALAIVSRQKHLIFCAVLVTIAPLPSEFIAYRGFFIMYIPFVGWAIYAASVLVGAREWLWRVIWKRPLLQPGAWEPERVCLFLLTAWFLFGIQHSDIYRSFDRIDPSQPRIRALQQSLSGLPLPKSVLFLRDPFMPQDFDPLFVVRLAYHDPNIPVDRVKGMPGGSSPNLDRYSLVLDYCNGRFVEVTAASRSQCTD
jgi:hypothetical protein